MHKLDEIITAAKSIPKKGVLYSSLTEVQKQAAMWVGEFFPAAIVNNEVVYCKTAKEVSLAPSFMYFRKQAQATPHELPGFGQNTFQVVMDEKMPPLEEVSWREAVNAFPSWKVPTKKNDYDHLPYLKLEKEIISPNTVEVAAAFAKIAVYINFPDTGEMPTNLDAIWKMCHIYHETAVEIAYKLGQTPAMKTILNYAPEKHKVGQTEVEGEVVDILRFKLPRGSLKIEYKGSYLANYITQALNNVYMVAPE